ncbi:MAG: DedA family protein [Thermomicrobia bacterium]|nr:DedA family protein [Thermomicrobia bacterium]MCA1723897.1 DedA family protein [Thermomicrobia bacterium]
MLGIALSHTFNFLLNAHPLIVIATLIFVEELGVPSPVPGDLMMLLAGVEVAQHRQHLWVVLLVQELATVAGASGLFAVSRRVGRPFVVRYGRFIHLTPTRLDHVERTVRRYGPWSVVAGRLIPGLRIITPIAVGVLDEPFLVFLPALACGGFLYILAITLTGVFVGPAALSTFERISLPIGAVCSLIVLGVLLFIMRKVRGALREERGLFLGVIAGVAALLATNGLLGFLRFGFRLFGGAGVLAATGIGSGWRLLLGWPVFLLVASLLGALYHTFAWHRWPPLARIALLSLPPLIITALVLDPLLEGHGPGLARRRDEVLLAVEVVRWLVFGLALNAIMPPNISHETTTDVAAPADPQADRPVLSKGSGTKLSR